MEAMFKALRIEPQVFRSFSNLNHAKPRKASLARTYFFNTEMRITCTDSILKAEGRMKAMFGVPPSGGMIRVSNIPAKAGTPNHRRYLLLSAFRLLPTIFAGVYSAQ